MSSSIADDEFPNRLSSVENRLSRELRHRSNLWRSNYHEASIYIEEGLNNDKFENHPQKRASRLVATSNNQTPAYYHQHETSSESLAANQYLTPCIGRDTCNPKADSDKSENPKSNTSTNNNNDGNNSAHHNAYILGGQYTTIETYILVHNRYFYQLDLIASIVLLLLALVEEPAIYGYELSPNIHAAIEMFALGIIAIELLLKFRWMGPRRFFRHGRTVTKLVVLVTMNLEAIVIFLRRSIHARYSRALRPIFLIDNHYCHGLRRAVRQIFQSLPPIIDMFTLVIFFMFVFSIFGFYMFASHNPYFSTMPTTVGNLLLLATTANLPDVMMPSYAVSRWSAIFFVLFIIIHLFLFTNLTMAAVYEIFTRKEKEKFHKLLLHRRKACQEAFKFLVTRRQPNRIEYRQFMGLMRYLNRKCSMFDAYLIFKALDTDKNGSISLEEFYHIYDYINLDWKLIYPEIKWYEYHDWIPDSVCYTLVVCEKIVRHKFFEWTIDFLIAVQAFLQFVEASAFDFHIRIFNQSSTTPMSAVPISASLDVSTNTSLPGLNTATVYGPQSDVRPDTISTHIFIFIFITEAILRCLAIGPSEYWSKRWNQFDVVVLLIAIAGLITGYFEGHAFGWVIVLRVLRLMRLFEFKRRYRDMWQTLTYILLKRFVGMTCVVMIMYYFFAIFGMEILSEYDLRNCCKNTSIESQFKVDNSIDGAKYYLNDFGDVVAGYMTLFSMSSSTYWLTLMDAYAIVSGTDWVRLYFGLYYLCSIIVMNIVIAFILESFLFHIHYRNKMGDNCDDTNLFAVSVTLSSFEVDFLRKTIGPSGSGMKGLERVVEKVKQKQNQLDPNFSDENNDNENNNDELRLLLKSKGKNEGQRSRKYPNYLALTPDINRTSDAHTRRPSIPKIRATPHSVASSSSYMPSSATLAMQETGRPTLYLIYQAEQIRNKFSFTMKMYADEVGTWLAEAEMADQDAVSTMISRNQIRAEHVAMARLVRSNLANLESDPEHFLTPWSRPRSYSTSEGVGERRRSKPDKCEKDGSGDKQDKSDTTANK